ncbi:hypothetical protein CRG95_02195 [Escherichia sp. E4208]|nr:hypothetical protein CRI66_16120 [Escherichia sp. E4694]TGB87931.1 hypothetical protein CRG95_02195 [Escherichia sp. E4208]TGC18292.1 hypothetical protein CRU79_05410 [Escherichia sp. E4385]TLI97870.1 hypothetical protein FEK41_10530 [Escherichia sp. E4694]TLJ04584.1 hypothetical protein FEK49_01580 [Escherichia sp. E4385]
MRLFYAFFGFPSSDKSFRLTNALCQTDRIVININKTRTIGYKERVCVSSPWRVVLAFLLAPVPYWNMRGKN